MKLGRNDLCHCGSGKKYKKCCLGKIDHFIFEIKLIGFESFYCQIGLSGSSTLWNLHNLIQRAFNWDYDHMFAFFMDNKFWNPKSQYSANPLGEGKASNTNIQSLSLHKGMTFAYVFDFGDDHRFQIEVLCIESDTDETNEGIIKIVGTPPEQYEDWNSEECDHTSL